MNTHFLQLSTFKNAQYHYGTNNTTIHNTIRLAKKQKDAQEMLIMHDTTFIFTRILRGDVC